MNTNIPESLILIAGKDAYPLLLAESARMQGVKHIFAVAFKGETRREIERVADEVRWLHVGALVPFLATLKESGATQAVMAGQITPSNIFNVRLDKQAMELLKAIKVRNAHTVFGALIEKIEELGITLCPASRFMEAHMPEPGLLSRRAPTEQEQADIELGLQLVKGTSEFEIGQTVVIKEGIIIAVEAFEGTDHTIRRAGKVGGTGSVVVKVPKSGHDMRFDIPVVGTKTFKVLKRAKVSCLAVQARKSILLEKKKLIALADAMDMAFVAVEQNRETIG
ncbi:MAG: LpxI family protein [Candidatus Pacebacteria bacterium]|nr:LpxI family protein [Candidatus Paceibacterota bacterium]